MLVSSALTERAAHGAVMGLLPAPLCRRRCRHGCACGTVEWRKVGVRAYSSAEMAGSTGTRREPCVRSHNLQPRRRS